MKLKTETALNRFKLERFSKTLDAALKNLAMAGRGRKQAISMASDACLAGLCLWMAYTLRHGGVFSDFRSTWYLFLLLPVSTVALFSGLGIYRWVIRSINHRLFKQLLKGTILSSLVLLISFFLIPPDRSNPRSLFVIYGLLLMISTTGVRLIWKALFDEGEKGEPTAIYGAGAAGHQLVSMLSAGDLHRPVLFIDDNKALGKSTLLGLPVYHGKDSALLAELERFEVSKVVMAMPSLPPLDYHRKLQELEVLGLPVLTMPGVAEIMDGSAKADEIRDVSIGDILGRGEVAPNRELMGRRVAGKTVLVTGGGGSIGSELCRQIMTLKPEHLILMDNCEANLYHITEELNALPLEVKGIYKSAFTPLIGNVLDKVRLTRLMRDNSVDTVYHAAAYKHVPIVEAQPDQGVDVNVFGTLTVLETAIEHGVSDFVLISTDKAVRPTNAMGATKRVAELVLQAKAAQNTGTRISMVRFGNVLGSSGSVVPKFKRQILEGGPITLTHSDVTRYFMTIPEAAQLVLQASAIAKGGDVFVLDMGDPVRIEDLATTMVRLYGRKLQRDTGDKKDIEIVVEGLRPGEKLYEELFISDSFFQTEVAKISSTNELWLEWDLLYPKLEKLRRFAFQQDSSAIKAILLSLAFISDNHADKASKNGSISVDLVDGSRVSTQSAVGDELIPS